MSEYPSLPNQTVTEQPLSGFGMDQGGFEGSRNQNFGSLAPLMSNNKFLLRQRYRWSDLFDDCTGCTVEKKYTLHGENGEMIFSAAESSRVCQQCCCGSDREFQMAIHDMTNMEVLLLDRPLNCSGCCCECAYPSYTQSLTVSRQGQKIGIVRERATWVNPVFHVFDNQEQKLFKIRGPYCHYACFDDIVFDVTDPAGQQIGSITKKWMGLCTETLSKQDNFQIEIRDRVDLNGRCLIIGAAFLIDFMYFEEDNSD